MSNLKPVREWLETIADKNVRESAISQIDENSEVFKMFTEDGKVSSLPDAIQAFNAWDATVEGYGHWFDKCNKSLDGTLPTISQKITLSDANTLTEKYHIYPREMYEEVKQADGSILIKPIEDEKRFIVVYENTYSGSLRSTNPLTANQLEEDKSFIEGSKIIGTIEVTFKGEKMTNAKVL